MKQVRIAKERLVQFIQQEAAAQLGVEPDRLGTLQVFLQSDEQHRPLDVIVDVSLPVNPSTLGPAAGDSLDCDPLDPCGRVGCRECQA